MYRLYYKYCNTTIKSFFSGTYYLIDKYSNTDSVLLNEDVILLNEDVILLNKVALAYALDPTPNAAPNFWGRYGLIPGMDFGYKYTGAHVFDARYQFLGSTGDFDVPSDERNYGSVGLQYSWQNYDLPDWTGMNVLQKFLGLEFNRKDFLVPLIFSHSFGLEEKYGAISGGVIYGHTFIKYSFSPKNIYRLADSTGTAISKELIPTIQAKQNFLAFGVFGNMKFGYKYVMGFLALSVYYQKYGEFELLDGSKTTFKGMTFVPSAGLFFDIPFKKIFGKKLSLQKLNDSGNSEIEQ